MRQTNTRSYQRNRKRLYKQYGIRPYSVKSHSKGKEILVFLSAFIIAIFIYGYELKLLGTEILVDHIIREGINYDAFREMRVKEEALVKADQKINKLIKKKPDLRDMKYMDRYGYLTFSMLVNEYNLADHNVVDETTFYRGIGKVSATAGFQELYEYYKAILSNLKYFPVPKVEAADIFYDNSWYEKRNYGGNRRHEGTDLMASNNERGFFPIISMTDGIIEKMGWLEQGGYRIGIRSDSGGYFYYAHLSSYAPGLEQGDAIIAGQLLGFMGDSGYGSEGTIGQFDVHLHLGIYVNSITGEMSVDPYWILRILEKYRTNYNQLNIEKNNSIE